MNSEQKQKLLNDLVWPSWLFCEFVSRIIAAHSFTFISYYFSRERGLL